MRGKRAKLLRRYALQLTPKEEMMNAYGYKPENPTTIICVGPKRMYRFLKRMYYRRRQGLSNERVNKPTI